MAKATIHTTDGNGQPISIEIENGQSVRDLIEAATGKNLGNGDFTVRRDGRMANLNEAAQPGRFTVAPAKVAGAIIVILAS